ncbi:hypothetical protein PLEOSDRAFT_1085499 [Pleurotus ostreatus PC15]|uniref:Uncharacterized protein n=1 Tax=Pleurotus ostreatus (strain PC15) TaxID=1137138 RepID=A0A067N8P5_PLEO1|nr:hypothetical protein PLEOSDRAFT_1085499 [Pleurotus ostreatus PC15]
MAGAETASATPCIGLATALFTVMSIPAIRLCSDYLALPLSSSRATLLVLWLVTAALTPGMTKILGPNAFVFYGAVLSILTVKAIIEGHLNAWMTSSMELLAYPKDRIWNPHLLAARSATRPPMSLASFDIFINFE